MFRTVDRYIVREIIPPLLISLLVLTFVLEIPPLADQAEKLIAKGVAWPIILRVLATLLPQALALTIPMALLVGLLIGFGRLSADREFVALQACGVSLYRLLRPVAILALACWAAASYVIIVALPNANQAFREITYGIIASRAASDVKPRVFFDDFPQQVLYVQDVTADGRWHGVFLADTQQPDRTVVYFAKTGRLALDRVHRKVAMVLDDGTRHTTVADKPDSYQAMAFKQFVLTLDPQAVFPRSTLMRGEREMTIQQLHQQIQQSNKLGLSSKDPEMEIQKKFSIPVACLVFALIGLALGASSRRDGKLSSFVVGVAVIFVYYVIMWMGQAMATGGQMSPGLAPWLPNIVLGAFGVVAILWRARSADQPLRIALPLRRRQPADGTAAASPADRTARGGRVVLVVKIPSFSFPRPHLLDLYVAKQYLRVFALGFLGLLGIFYISTFIDLSDKLFKGQATMAMLLQYFYYATPQFVYYVIPITTLVATLVTVGLLTKNSELAVMKACGISLYRVALPLVLFGALASGTLFTLEEHVLAASNRRADTLHGIMKGYPPRTLDVMNRHWVVGRHGAIYHYGLFDPRRDEFDHLTIYQVDPQAWRLTGMTFASRVASVPVRTAGGGLEMMWDARDGWVRRFGAAAPGRRGDPHVGAWTRFSERRLDLEPAGYFKTAPPDAEQMTYSQLKRYIGQLRAAGFYVVPYVVALQKKIAFPFVAVIMTLLAVPFAVSTGRRGAMYGIGIGIVLAVTYWIMLSFFIAVGSSGVLTPLLAAWAPNLLFGAGAAYLLLTVRT
ncbi:MAG TPA: LPS export ABC transporter permease LptF [Vicinamibacterales bacterium]|nr:LPS export ABC transporter permease LptF [Vicinamibacterales bacterium]